MGINLYATKTNSTSIYYKINVSVVVFSRFLFFKINKNYPKQPIRVSKEIIHFDDVDVFQILFQKKQLYLLILLFKASSPHFCHVQLKKTFACYIRKICSEMCSFVFLLFNFLKRNTLYWHAMRA